MIAADALFDLIIPAARSTGAPRLAATVGATHLCIFIRDPELLRFLPAPGFCRTLPKGLQWAAFLRDVERDGDKTGILPSPYTGLVTPISARLLEQDTISVLFGEGVDLGGHEKLRSAILVLSALGLQELRTRLAEIQGALATTSAMESKRLAQSLSEVHDRLAATLQRTLQLSEELHRQQERLDLARRISGIGFWEYHADRRVLALSRAGPKDLLVSVSKSAKSLLLLCCIASIQAIDPRSKPLIPQIQKSRVNPTFNSGSWMRMDASAGLRIGARWFVAPMRRTSRSSA